MPRSMRVPFPFEWVVALLALSVAAWFQVAPARAGESAVTEIQRAAYAADFSGGIKNLEAMAATDPTDGEALFGIGGLRFLGALATLQEGLWRHAMVQPVRQVGLNRGLSMFGGFGLLLGGPVLLPPNPAATPMSYKAFRAVLARFADDLAAAEKALSRVGERPVKVTLEPARIAFDLDHDGRIAPHEYLLRFLASRRGTDTATFAFDTADASWLRGYANLLMASVNLFLACDFETTYEATAHNAYGNAATAIGRTLERQRQAPRAQDVIDAELAQVELKLANLGELPSQEERKALNELLKSLPKGKEGQDARRAAWDKMRALNQSDASYNRERNELQQEKRRLQSEKAGILPGAEYATVLDLAQAVHTINWPVIEPKRLANVRLHLLEVMALNRQTWRLVRAETDDDREWLPNARQASPFLRPQLSDEVIDSWLATTALAEEVLKGEKLLPHPRFNKGVNLKRYLETTRRIDLVGVVTGHALVAYLEDGDIVTSRTWRALTRPLEHNLGSFAIWFN